MNNLMILSWKNQYSQFFSLSLSKMHTFTHIQINTTQQNTLSISFHFCCSLVHFWSKNLNCSNSLHHSISRCTSNRHIVFCCKEEWHSFLFTLYQRESWRFTIDSDCRNFRFYFPFSEEDFKYAFLFIYSSN